VHLQKADRLDIVVAHRADHFVREDLGSGTRHSPVHPTGQPGPDGSRFEVVVVHHNQCGTHFLAEPEFRHGFAQLMGVEDETALEAEAVVNPAATVKVDVDLVLADPRLPRTITVSGHVYDVTTGLLSTVVPATPMPTA
jgi:hypothetical protein